MAALIDLLREEKTAKLLQGLFQMAGSFVMEQVSGGNTDEKERELLQRYYSSAMQVAKKSKGQQILPSSMKEQVEPEEEPLEPEHEPQDVPKVSVRDTETTACVACSRNHIAAAAGLLAEGKRFLDQGLSSPEVVDRINLATQEITTMERGDLHPDTIERLPEDEKKIAVHIAQEARKVRHTLDKIKTKEDYVHAIRELSDLSRDVTKQYYSMMENISPEKEYEAMKKLCEGKPESERKACMQTMTQILNK